MKFSLVLLILGMVVFGIGVSMDTSFYSIALSAIGGFMIGSGYGMGRAGE